MIAQGRFDAEFPHIIAIDDVMNNLPNRPRIRSRAEVQVRVSESGKRSFQSAKPIGV